MSDGRNRSRNIPGALHFVFYKSIKLDAFIMFKTFIKKTILIYTILAICIFYRVGVSQPVELAQGVRGESRQIKTIKHWISTEFGQYQALSKHLYSLVEQDSVQIKNNNSVVGLLGGQGLRVVEYSEEDLVQYFQSCLADKLTNLRALTIIACLSRKMNTVFYIDGELISNVLGELAINPGLCFPFKNLRCLVMIPDEIKATQSSSFQCRMINIYKRKFTHMFPKEIIDINLKIGVGESIELDETDSDNRESLTGYLVKGDMVYCEDKVGIVNVEGIAGEKQEFVGKFQKVFSFIPDFIKSMTIKSSGDLVAETLINETIEDFENKTKYQVHRNGVLAWERELFIPSGR